MAYTLSGQNVDVYKRQSHGSANVDAFARAIADAALQARLQIPQKILAGLQRY